MRAWQILAPLSTERDPRVEELRKHLDVFYASTSDYGAFQEDASMPEYWEPIRLAVAKTIEVQGTCRILEFGAGRSDFGSYLGELRARVVWDVQDVTATNEARLRKRADHVYIGDLADIHQTYDIVFSTFVWEHITNPRAVLNHLLELLNPEGRLILTSPRYEFPLYVPPSARHYSKPRQMLISIWILWQRLVARWDSDSRFLIHLDPAVFQRPWFRDADAIHWVSAFDIRSALPRGYHARCLRPAGKTSLLGSIFRRFMLLFVEITRVGDR